MFFGCAEIMYAKLICSAILNWFIFCSCRFCLHLHQNSFLCVRYIIITCRDMLFVTRYLTTYYWYHIGI